MSEDNGGNGKLTPEPIKTEEQIKTERASRYTSDPDTFIEISELICAVVRNLKSQLGVSVIVGNAKRSEMDIAQCELNSRIEFVRHRMDVESAERSQSKIVPAKHGMLDGARKIFGRK